MTIINERTRTNRRTDPYNLYSNTDVDDVYGHLDQQRRLLAPSRSGFSLTGEEGFFQHIHLDLFPSNVEEEDNDDSGENRRKTNNVTFNPNSSSYSEGSRHNRVFRRRVFLFLTEPSSSLFSAFFFFCLIFAIALSSMIMIMQTMSFFQYTPTKCHFCGSATFDTNYYNDDEISEYNDGSNDNYLVECECPPRPSMYLERILNRILQFFAVEWTLRVLSYVPAHPKENVLGNFGDWLKYLASPATLIDALAIWPHFMERLHVPGLISLRLLRLFRVFQLLRLGSYNSMFVSLTTVLSKSMEFLKLLIVIVFFGATIFGSLMYWLEQGEWKYWEPTGNFQYIRMRIDGETEEISPFTSIPTAFWWFVVTATTVGYGDYYPTSVAGMWVGTVAMLTGVLVVAFPVSVFSEIWSKELKQVHGLQSLFRESNASGSDDENGNDSNENFERECKDRGDRRRLRDQYQPIYSEPESSSRNSTRVIMDSEDLNDILSSIYTIQQEQRHIQKVLKKYYVHKE